jgi:hypothetical protein
MVGKLALKMNLYRSKSAFSQNNMFAVHIFAVLFSLCVVFLADKDALAWVMGWKQTLGTKRVAIYHWLTWAGLLSVIGSGAYLALPQLSYLLTQPLFIMKILFVAILFINAILIGRFAKIATERAFSALTWEETMPLFVSGAISFFGWSGAAVLGLIFFQ